MTYIENIFVLLAAPLAVCLVVVSGKYRVVVASLLSGMLACLLSSYVSTFFAQWMGADSTGAAVEIAPVVEETIKLLPLLFYLLVLEPQMEHAELAAIFIAVGFATMESGFFLAESGTSSPVLMAMRGISAAMMHLACGVVMSYGVTHVWPQVWIKLTGTFGLLCLVITFHGFYNLLIAAGGWAQTVAVILPLAVLVMLVALQRRDASRTE